MDGARDGRITLRAGSAAVDVMPEAGGRLGGLVVDGWDLLVRHGPTPIDFGCYPMVPWAGRLRDGVLRWRGAQWRFPPTMPPHAIHGTLLQQPWDVIDGGEGSRSVVLGASLEAPWPFGGSVRQRIELSETGLGLALEVTAGARAMPIIMGWHPWFVRQLLPRDDGAVAAPVELAFTAGAMLAASPPGIPDGRRVPPPPGPWDDTFVDLADDPVVRWRGAVELALRSPEATAWVVFTEQRRGDLRRAADWGAEWAQRRSPRRASGAGGRRVAASDVRDRMATRVSSYVDVAGAARSARSTRAIAPTDR